MKKIYKVEQNIIDDYDTYDSFVCIAKDEDEARKMHPSDIVTHVSNGKWMGTYSGGSNIVTEYETGCSGWVDYCDIDKIKVTLIGMANPDEECGIIVASFNAG